MFDPGTSKVVVADDSGMCSPTLWEARSPVHNHKNHYRSLSPESKIQAIERGQRELMEMVRNMPESCYELTLKDLVVEKKKEEPKVEEKKNLHFSNKKKEGVSISNSKKVDKRISGKNIDSAGGFYLKMVFPISLGSKNNNNNNNKKKKESLGNSSKVSPRTSSSVSDKEWWKKKSESNNSGSSIKSYGSSTSSSHSSSSRSNSRHEMSASSCWPFIRR